MIGGEKERRRGIEEKRTGGDERRRWREMGRCR